MNEKKKNNRYIICCSDPFPFGSANSNYIRNMALALKNAGKKVLVIGLLEGENFLDGEENGRFQGICPALPAGAMALRCVSSCMWTIWQTCAFS